MRRVVIVGGGITGLAAAWALRQTSAPQRSYFWKKVTVWEDASIPNILTVS